MTPNLTKNSLNPCSQHQSSYADLLGGMFNSLCPHTLNQIIKKAEGMAKGNGPIHWFTGSVLSLDIVQNFGKGKRMYTSFWGEFFFFLKIF